MKAELLKSLAKGMAFCTGMILIATASLLFAQTVTTFNSGEVVSSSSINQNFQNIVTTIQTNLTLSAPTGKISAFYLTTCPTGWIQADGNSGTPDLRGVFLRGLNSFDGGTTSNARDPQDTGARSIGHYQTESFASHTHTIDTGPVAGGPIGSIAHTGSGITASLNTYTQSAGSTETRPENVALIFCMRN